MPTFAILDFMQVYKDYPCLWNPKHADHKNQAEKDKAIRELMQICDVEDAQTLRKNIHSIRKVYCYEVRKIKKSIDSGSIYKPTLKWFDLAHSFLAQTLSEPPKKCKARDASEMKLKMTRTTKGKPCIVMEGKRHRLERVNGNNICHWRCINSACSGRLTIKSGVVLSHREHNCEQPRKRPKKIKTPDPGLDPLTSFKVAASCLLKAADTAPEPKEQLEALPAKRVEERHSISTSTQPQLQTWSLESDEFRLFGEQIGVQLSKLPLESALRVQQVIQGIITEARLKEMSKGSPQNSSTCSRCAFGSSPESFAESLEDNMKIEMNDDDFMYDNAK